MESRCGALSPPSSISPISAKRFTLSLPFQMNSKKIFCLPHLQILCLSKSDWRDTRTDWDDEQFNFPLMDLIDSSKLAFAEGGNRK